MATTEALAENKKISELMFAGLVFTIVSVLVSTLWAMFAYKQVLDMRAEYSILKDSVARLHMEEIIMKHNLTQQNVAPAASDTGRNKADFPKEQDVKVEEPAIVEQAAKTPEKPKVKKTEAAVAERQKREDNKVSSGDIVLFYYFRRADNQSLPEALKETGYHFELKSLDKNTGYEKSNCIWFGAGVPISDVKTVAIAMIQSGNPVKGIKKFPLSIKNPSYKRNIIEVGMDERLEKIYTKPLSIFEVERAKGFR